MAAGIFVGIMGIGLMVYAIGCAWELLRPESCDIFGCHTQPHRKTVACNSRNWDGWST
jgi:hypothetical protein